MMTHNDLIKILTSKYSNKLNFHIDNDKYLNISSNNNNNDNNYSLRKGHIGTRKGYLGIERQVDIDLNELEELPEKVVFRTKGVIKLHKLKRLPKEFGGKASKKHILCRRFEFRDIDIKDLDHYLFDFNFDTQIIVHRIIIYRDDIPISTKYYRMIKGSEYSIKHLKESGYESVFYYVRGAILMSSDNNVIFQKDNDEIGKFLTKYVADEKSGNISFEGYDYLCAIEIKEKISSEETRICKYIAGY